MWCPDVSASLNFAPVVYSEDHQTEPKSGFEIVGLKSLVWKRSFQARLTSMMNNFKNML